MIRIDRLSKSFDNIIAVDQVSLEFPAGSTTVIFGPSGSGKTTLLRLIAGLEVPDDGEIHINGILASRPGWVMPPHRRGIGFAFQTSALWPHMTVGRNIIFGLHGMPKIEARARLHDLLEEMSLTGLEHRYPHQLSGGEARRVSLARTLAPRPACLLMDEPLTNVDRELQERLLDLIKQEMLQTGASLIYVTHNAEEAKQLSERVVELDNGHLRN